MKPLVIDIYHGDLVKSFDQVKEAGVRAVIHKASEGTNPDNRYTARRKIFTDLGLKYGAYHFFHGDGIKEADFFLNVAEPDKDLVLALDWENTAHTPNAKQARAFLERIEEKLGRKAVIYSGNVAKEKIIGKDTFFGSHLLWLAQYANHWKVQESWTKPWLWQYGSEITKTRVPGINSYCDVNDILDADPEKFFENWGK